MGSDHAGSQTPIVKYERGQADNRPWGRWEVIDVGRRFVAKRITVNAGASLSLQMHHFREEHWVIVSGTARVTLGDGMFELRASQSTHIPVQTKHRIENIGDEVLEFIEVQYGEQLDEKDIVRFEDNYGRT